MAQERVVKTDEEVLADLLRRAARFSPEEYLATCLSRGRERQRMFGERFGHKGTEAGPTGRSARVPTQQSDPYKVLGVSSHAEDKEIDDAYRKLARELHPDANVDLPLEERVTKEERLKLVNSAYHTIRQSRA